MREIYDWNALITEFLKEYVTEDSVQYTPDGNMTFSSITACVELLLNKKVFTSIADMKAEAMKNFGIVLPDTVFPEATLERS